MKRASEGMTRITCDWPDCTAEFRSASLKSAIPKQLAAELWRVEPETAVIGPSGVPLGKDMKNRLHICNAHKVAPRMGT